MLNDLAALTPPFLVCAAFLIAVGAFIKHEMRAEKNPDDDEGADVSAHLSEHRDGKNLADSQGYAQYHSTTRSESEPDQDQGVGH